MRVMVLVLRGKETFVKEEYVFIKAAGRVEIHLQRQKCCCSVSSQMLPATHETT